jgi:hypothetical protein
MVSELEMKIAKVVCQIFLSSVNKKNWNYIMPVLFPSPLLNVLCSSTTGLPDGWFIFIPKPQFGYTLEGLKMENVGILCNHLKYFTPAWYISKPF